MPSITIGETLSGPNGETFKIKAFLGQGAFGEVYRAVGNSSGVVVAVKLLPVSTLSSENSRIALLNEIRASLCITPNSKRSRLEKFREAWKLMERPATDQTSPETIKM